MNAALVPVRSIAGGKNRLASGLDGSQREALAVAMLEDMLEALSRAVSVDRTFVVSADPDLLEHARRHGAGIIDEEQPSGLNAAVTMAAKRLQAEGVNRLLTIPGDVPLLEASEIDAAFAFSAEKHPVVLVPSASLTGTNGLLTSPPTVIDFCFEGESLAAHRQQCRDRGIPMLVSRQESFAIDVDTPADLAGLSSRPGCRTGRLLQIWKEHAIDPTSAARPAEAG